MIVQQARFEDFEAAIAEPAHQLAPGARLAIPAQPDPFVPATLRVVESDSSAARPLAVEVVIVEASAAVGKSTMARYLASSRRVPLLNLAEVPVSTHSLIGLIQSELTGDGDPVQAFHQGRLPIVIDALDEGRLLSGENSFERFLETTGELLQRNRTGVDRPKLIFLGRHESADLTRIALRISGPDVTMCQMEVSYFGERAAWELIQSYARSSASADAAYWSHEKPVRELIESYFSAIEKALGIAPGQLWTTEPGRTFAGYAPVLAALGQLLAEMKNFVEVANRLRSGGTQEAWDVIETVLNEILDREQRKVTEPLASQIHTDVPPSAYDREEQLTLLAGFVHGQPLASSDRVQLPAADQTVYYSMVERYLPEHPFVRQGRPSNDVLGSLILAHAVSNDLLKDTDLRLLEDSSWQPFLWRSIRGELKSDSLIDGRYVGCILGSYWNDPLTQDRRIVIRSTAEGAARVYIPESGSKDLEFDIALPLRLYGQVRDSDIDVAGSVVLQGYARGSASTLYLQGTTSVVCDSMEVAADAVTLDGTIWLEAERVTSSPRLNVHVRAEAQIGFAGQFGQGYPWNRLRPTLTALRPVRTGDDLLVDLVVECGLRLPPGGVVTLNPDFTIADDNRLRWIASRQFDAAFPRMIRAMAELGFASAERMQASGDAKVRVRVKTPWADLQAALLDPSQAGDLYGLVTELRRVIVG